MNKSEKYFIVPVFLPQLGCTHRCAFCNQTAITGVKQQLPSPGQIQLLINTFLGYKSSVAKKVQVSFYGGNFLGLKQDYIKSILSETAEFVSAGRIDSIRFSTRPDTISGKTLDILADYPVATIELGVQSMDDRVLAMSKRGHTILDTFRAVSMIKERGFELGLQMMVGLPGDSETGALNSGRMIADLSPDFVRIYPTVVLAGSLLAGLYRQGKYTPLPLEVCVTLVKKLYLLFRGKKIRVVRMGLQASQDLSQGSTVLAGPYHPAFGHLVMSEVFLDIAVAAVKAVKNQSDTLTIKVHSADIPKMRGIKNKNIEILKNRFKLKSIKIIPDPSIAKDSIAIIY